MITKEDSEHRKAFLLYVKNHAEPWYKANLGRLYDLWEEWNIKYFESKLIPPYILLTDMQGVRTMGDCSNFSGFGGKSQIRLRKAIITGDFGIMKQGSKDPEGCFLVIADTLLHEMIHQYMQEVEGDAEEKYKGHGPKFRDHCNRIGKDLDFLPVKTAKEKSKELSDTPLCAYWPHRKDAYYLGSFPSRTIFGARKKKEHSEEAIDEHNETAQVSETQHPNDGETEENAFESATYPQDQDAITSLLKEAKIQLSEQNYNTLRQLVNNIQ